MILLTSLLLLLVGVSAAHAERARVLWESYTIVKEGNPTAWTRLSVRGTEAECQRAAFEAASDTWFTHHRTRHFSGEVVREGTRVTVQGEFENMIFTFVCLPDTVDPRGPKGTK